MTDKETARIKKIIETHKDTIEWCTRELVTNCEVPAQRTINHACAKMGIDRIDWAKIEAIKNNHEYERPTAAQLRRWARY